MPPAKEDVWSWVEIGEPFPDMPIRCRGHNNQYVALWYRHGKPVQGRAWNNGGVVECSFPGTDKELTGKKDLGGKIQILAYPANDEWEGFPKMGYYYQWLKYGDFKAEQRPHLELCHCGDVTVILGKAANGEELCGDLNYRTDTVRFSYGGKVETITDPRKINEMMVICRNLNAPPPKTEAPKLKRDQWLDRKIGDKFPGDIIMALDRPLKVENGQTAKMFCALWYMHGEPVMGRCWEDAAGKLQASFGYSGREITGNVGSLQVLAYYADRSVFSYKWMPFGVAIENYRNDKEWQPMHVGDCATCVCVEKNGFEMLGKVIMSQAKASYAWGGKEVVFTGPEVKEFMVLCRNPPQSKTCFDA